MLPSHVLKSLLWEAQKPLFSSLDHQGLCKFYIKSCTWHHIFVFFATFLDDEKCCRNYVYPGTKRAQTAKIVSAGQKLARLEKEYFHSDWNSDTNILMAGGEGGDIVNLITQIHITLWRHHRNVQVTNALLQVIILIVPVILSNRSGPKCVHTLLSFLTVRIYRAHLVFISSRLDTIEISKTGSST